MAPESRQIGPYEVLENLGSGAAGEVYRAKQTETGEQVALKLVHAKHSDDEEVQKRFVREVAILERLKHPNIVEHRDCGLHDESIYFAMELVDAGSLSDVLKRRGSLPWRESVEVAIQVADALHYAAEQGIVHRDLKPENLFLASEGRVMVGDFGLARDNTSHRLTIDGQTVGTCLYMAPEQIRGQSDLTGAVDLYALGCLLYRMIVGQTPFMGSSVVEVLDQHIHMTPPSLRGLAPQVPQALSDRVAQLLAKDPAERGQSADEVAAALREVLVSPDDACEPSASASEAPAPEAPASEQKNLTERLQSVPSNAGHSIPTNKKIALAVGALIALLVIAGLMSR